MRNPDQPEPTFAERRRSELYGAEREQVWRRRTYRTVYALAVGSGIAIVVGACVAVRQLFQLRTAYSCA